MNFFEASDLINTPFECIDYDSKNNVFPVLKHYHYYLELIYMKEGICVMQNANDTYEVHPGEMMLFHPNVMHAMYSKNNEYVKYSVIKLDINRMFLSSTYSPKLRSIYKSIEKKNYSVKFPKEYVDRIKANEIIDKCIDECRQRKYGYDQVVLSMLYLLLINILRYYQDKGFVINAETFAEDSRYDIFCISDFIDNHINENIKVNDIAKVCGMSYSYFAKKFQSVYGKSCKEYLEEMQLYKAEELLMFTDFDLTYIANECGFSDCSHLINSFKKHKKMTPKQFRKMQNDLN
ncbi:MAG: AraC family transcriptional regulator [Lachnospiraceae bacterium]|nr:AraC family transcriptional regulator [Lachnospiraceae bacterium]